MTADIKPVAWRVANSPHGPFALRKAVPRGWAHHEPLYPQSAIDALQAEVERLKTERDVLVREGIRYAEKSGRLAAEVKTLRDAASNLADGWRKGNPVYRYVSAQYADQLEAVIDAAGMQ